MLSSYTITRKGQGQQTAKEDGIEIQNLAPWFRKKISEPYFVTYQYSEELQNKPIHLTKHSGQEFDFIIKGRLKIQVGDNVEYLSEGDSIYYNFRLSISKMKINITLLLTQLMQSQRKTLINLQWFTSAEIILSADLHSMI